MKCSNQLSSQAAHDLILSDNTCNSSHSNSLPKSEARLIHDSLHFLSKRIIAESQDDEVVSDSKPSDSSVTSITIGIAGITASLINREYQEISYIAIEGINFSFQELSNKDIYLELNVFFFFFSDSQLSRLQMDNCIFGAQYPVVFGSPIHSPFYKADGSSDLSVRRMNALSNASESLVSGYYSVPPNPNRNNRLFHFSAHLPYNTNVIYVKSLDVITYVSLLYFFVVECGSSD